MFKNNFKMNKIWFAISVLLLMLMAAGCGSAPAANQEGASPAVSQAAAAAPTPAPAPAAAAANPAPEVRTIKHVMGETKITGTPQKMVALYQGASDVAVAYGIKPVGIVESWMEQPVYNYLRAQLGDVPQLGAEHQPNLEAISKLKPDVIFASKLRHEKIYNQLSQIAPTVMINEVYEWKETVRLIGEVMNRQEQGAKLMQDWNNRVADFKAKMGSRLPMEATITNFRADHARIFYMGYAGGILKELGFTRPKGHDAETWGVMLTSKESIKDMNAELIFNFYSAADPKVDKLYKEWTEHPLWKNLEAVKKNQVVTVDEVSWNYAGGYISANNMLDELYAFFKLPK
jgi:iron complex transport system substrate-binding protein